MRPILFQFLNISIHVRQAQPLRTGVKCDCVVIGPLLHLTDIYLSVRTAPIDA